MSASQSESKLSFVDGNFTLQDSRRGDFFINFARGTWSLEFGPRRFEGTLGDKHHDGELEVTSFQVGATGSEMRKIIRQRELLTSTQQTAPLYWGQVCGGEIGTPSQAALRLGVRGRPEHQILLHVRLANGTRGELWITKPGGICWYEGDVSWAVSYIH